MKKYFSLVLLSVGICYGGAQEGDIHSQWAKRVTQSISEDCVQKMDGKIYQTYKETISSLEDISELSVDENSETQEIGEKTKNCVQKVADTYLKDIGDDEDNIECSLRVLRRICGLTFSLGAAGLGGKQIPYIMPLLTAMRMEKFSISDRFRILIPVLHSFGVGMKDTETFYEEVVTTTTARLQEEKGQVSADETVRIFEECRIRLLG